MEPVTFKAQAVSLSTADRLSRVGSKRGLWKLKALAALCLGAVVGCGSEPRESRTVRELSAAFAQARAVRERAEFVIGTADHEPRLGVGWSYGEVDHGRGRSFRWGTRPRSELDFTVLYPRDLTLRLEGLPAPGAKSPGSVRVEINGNDGGVFEVRDGLAEYAVPISRELLLRGENRLALVYGEQGTNNAGGTTDGRPAIAMSWYRVVLEGLEQPFSEPHVDPRGRLFIPRGSQIDFYLKLPLHSSLSVRRWRSVGAGSTHLAVHLMVDGEPERRLSSPGDMESLEIVLTQAQGRAARLSLAAIRRAAGPVSRTSPESGAAPAVVPTTTDAPGVLLDAPSIRSVSPPRAPADPKTSPRDRVERPNIIIYLVDTLRADRLGAYGHDRDVSPNIDRFAAGATLFENARAQSSWTLPAVASIFTGLWPPAHGVVGTEDKLSPDAITLAEHLRSAGYATSAIVANGFPSSTWGLDQGFEDHLKLPDGQRESHQVLERTISWLESRDRGRPFFLYLHTLDPHNPYLPAEEFRKRFAADADEVYRAILANPKRTRWEPTERIVSQLFSLYDALIAQNDDSFGLTLDYLEKENLFEDSLIVFVADHGEEFFEHGSWTHGANLFGETLNVPLIIKLPGQTEARRIAGVAQQIDLLPTLLEVLEIDPPELEGRSLLRAASGDPEARGPRPIFSHTSKYARETRSVIDGPWKSIERLEEDGVVNWLLEWESDPQEHTDRKADHPIRTEVLRRLIASRLEQDRSLATEEAVLDDEERRDLRALGYIE